MSEIQRYSISGHGALMPYHTGDMVKHRESEAWHLADKTAALEAQAEEHEKRIVTINTDWSRHVRKIDDKHTAAIVGQERAHHDSMTQLRKEHTTKLAEHETKLATIERLHKEEIAVLEAQQGEGEPETIDLLCEVVVRLLLDVGQHINPTIVMDLNLTEIQRRAERCSVRVLMGDPNA